MTKVHITLFAVALFYGIMFSLAGEIMPTYLSPEGFVWMRIAFAALCFHLISLFLPTEKANWATHKWDFLLCAFLGTSGNMYLFFKGLELTHPINGAVLMLVTPLAVAILDHIRIKQPMKKPFVLGLVAACTGAFWLMSLSNQGLQFNASTWKGDAFVAVNALLYAFYLVRVKNLTAHYGANTINRITFGLGFVYMTMYCLVIWWLTDLSLTTRGARSAFSIAFLGPESQQIPTAIWFKIAYTLIFVSFLVYLLNTYAVKKAGPTLAGIYIYLQPVLAAIIALTLGRDEMSLEKSICMALVLMGVWFAKENSPSVLSNRVSSRNN
jgi:drug/metabolite transporter (DMT)-like permease